MTAPNALEMTARLAEAIIASYELDETLAADLQRYRDIAAACRASEGQGAEEHMATGSLRGAPPAPAPSRDDDVEKTRSAIVEIVLTQLTTLGRMKDTDGWAATGHHLALLLDDALRPLAARLASQDERIENQRGELAKLVKTREREAARLVQFEALADRATWHEATMDEKLDVLSDLAALAKGGA